MANQHRDDKSKLTVWTETDLKKHAQEILKEKGETLTDRIVELLENIVKERVEKNAKSKKNS